MADQLDEENISLSRCKKLLISSEQAMKEQAVWYKQWRALIFERDKIQNSLDESSNLLKTKAQKYISGETPKNASILREQIEEVKIELNQLRQNFGSLNKKIVETEAGGEWLHRKTIELKNEITRFLKIHVEISELFAKHNQKIKTFIKSIS
jgi:hypothetical protein